MGRRIAADPTAQWRVLLTDDDGLVTAAGSRTYRPPADMTRTVIARDVHCCFPGCRRTARYNDLDHIQAYQPGDQTAQATLMSLCRRHHRFKHSGDWTVTRDDTTNITTWTDTTRPPLPNPTTHPTHHHHRNPNHHDRSHPGQTSHPGSQPRHHGTPARTRPRAAPVLTARSNASCSTLGGSRPAQGRTGYWAISR